MMVRASGGRLVRLDSVTELSSGKDSDYIDRLNRNDRSRL